MSAVTLGGIMIPGVAKPGLAGARDRGVIYQLLASRVPGLAGPRTGLAAAASLLSSLYSQPSPHPPSSHPQSFTLHWIELMYC